MKMFTLLITYLNLTSPMLMIFMMMNLYFNKSFMNPLKQILFLIFCSISMSFMIYSNTDDYLYPLMILIAYTSGVMILFSYFVCLLNIPFQSSKTILMSSTLTIISLLTMIFSTPFISFQMNYQKIFHLYFNSKMFLIIILILLLLIMLYLSVKICFTKFKSLRHK